MISSVFVVCRIYRIRVHIRHQHIHKPYGLESYTVMSKIINNTFSSIVFAGDLNTATINLFRAVVQLPSKIIALLYTWQTRLDDRKHIAELSDWQLKDIGLRRILADSESQKPFLIP